MTSTALWICDHHPKTFCQWVASVISILSLKMRRRWEHQCNLSTSVTEY